MCLYFYLQFIGKRLVFICILVLCVYFPTIPIRKVTIADENDAISVCYASTALRIRNYMYPPRKWTFHRMDTQTDTDSVIHCFDERYLSCLVFSRQTLYLGIILFRSIPLNIVTHTGIDKQQNGTEQEFLYIKPLESTGKR